MQNSLTGQEINGYRIGPLLGVGGMGEVYQATNAANMKVAIKFLRSDVSTEPNFQARFIREIRIMQALNHPNIVPILDHGLVDNSRLYYAMRLITGMALSTLAKRQPFTPATYWIILEQMAAALAFGHSQNVVHRDLKPDNIFVEKKPDGGWQVFVGDFGLGKREGQDNTLTEAGAAVGTPHYMSPEAIMGERPGKVSDVYSLGCLSYEMLLGRLPFNDPHAHTVAIAHVTRPVPKPSTVHPNFPAGLEAVLLKSLEKNPSARQQSINEFATDYRSTLSAMSDPERNTAYGVE